MKQKSQFLIAVLALSSLLASSAAEGQPSPGELHPLQVVATVLTLSEEQIHTLATILEAKARAIQPLAGQAHEFQQELARALETPHADPSAIGRLLLEIRQLQHRIGMVSAEAAARFEEHLTPEQRERLGHLRQAARVCPMLPAFQVVGLL